MRRLSSIKKTKKGETNICVYCYCGDIIWKYDPPWKPAIYPKPTTIPIPPEEGLPGPVLPPQPAPGVPINPWNLEKLKEYYQLLKDIKELEDKIGCPCHEERGKPDYIKLFEERIAALEGKNNPKCKCTTCQCKEKHD